MSRTRSVLLLLISAEQLYGVQRPTFIAFRHIVLYVYNAITLFSIHILNHPQHQKAPVAALKRCLKQVVYFQAPVVLVLTFTTAVRTLGQAASSVLTHHK